MPGSDVLDLVRIHLEAGHGDHVLLAILQEHEAAVIDAADVAGAEPASRQHHLRGLIGAVPVTLHYLRPLHAYFPGGIETDIPAFVIPCSDVRGWNRQADGSGENLVLEPAHGDYGRCLGESPSLAEWFAGD